MKKTGNKIRLGIFVFSSVLIFMVGIYFVGQKQQLFSKTFNVSCVFKDIGGLQVGNNIRFSGINVGVINNIQQITDTTVKVGLLINENTRKFIKKNALALIGTDGLMGNKMVSILPQPGSLAIIADGDNLETKIPISMDEIMLNVKVTSDNAAIITSDLADIIDNIHEGRGTIGKLLMDTGFAKNLDKTIVNLKQGTGGFKKNMDAASHSFLLRNFFKRKKKDKE